MYLVASLLWAYEFKGAIDPSLRVTSHIVESDILGCYFGGIVLTGTFENTSNSTETSNLQTITPSVDKRSVRPTFYVRSGTGRPFILMPSATIRVQLRRHCDYLTNHSAVMTIQFGSVPIRRLVQAEPTDLSENHV